MTARCDGCKHWDRKKGSAYAAVIGECTRAHPFWDRSTWVEDYDWGKIPEGEDHPGRVLLPEAASDLMWVQDGSDYRAILLTKPEFFCAHYEASDT